MNLLSFNAGKSPPSRLLIALILSVIVTGTTACSNDPEVSTSQTSTPQQIAAEQGGKKTTEATPSPTDIPTTPTPTPTLTPTPTSIPAPTPTLAIVQTTPTDTATPTPIDTATPLPQESRFEDFGFSIVVEDKESTVVTSLLEDSASATQGILLFEYKGIQAVLIWMPANTYSIQEVQTQLMALLTSAQPENTFNILTEGEITVDGYQGTFGAFSTQDAETMVTGGGIIGAWICGEQGVTPALLVAGTDDTTVQIRFKKLIDSFACNIDN